MYEKHVKPNLHLIFLVFGLLSLKGIAMMMGLNVLAMWYTQFDTIITLLALFLASEYLKLKFNR